MDTQLILRLAKAKFDLPLRHLETSEGAFAAVTYDELATILLQDCLKATTPLSRPLPASQNTKQDRATIIAIQKILTKFPQTMRDIERQLKPIGNTTLTRLLRLMRHNELLVVTGVGPSTRYQAPEGQTKPLPLLAPKSSKPRPKNPNTAPLPRKTPQPPPPEYTNTCNMVLRFIQGCGEEGTKVTPLAKFIGYDHENTGKILRKLREDGKILVRAGTAGPGTLYILVPGVVVPEYKSKTVLEDLLQRIPILLASYRKGLSRAQLQKHLKQAPQPGGVVMTAVRELLKQKILKTHKNEGIPVYLLA